MITHTENSEKKAAPKAAAPITTQTPEEAGVADLGLKFKAPSPDTPGYFALRKRVYGFVAKMVDPVASVTDMDALLDFLVEFVEAPADKTEARRIIEEQASRQQYLTMMGALIRSEGEEIFPFAPGGSSGNGSGEKADSRPTKPSSSSKRNGSA